MKTSASAGFLLIAAIFPVAALAQSEIPQPIPEVVEGFTVRLLAPVVSPTTPGVMAPTAMTFGPGSTDTGPDLYVATLDAGAFVGAPSPESTSSGGNVVRVSLSWTPLGPVATGISTFASGFSGPLGVVFDPADSTVLYVSDSHPNAATGRTDGRVTRLGPGQSMQGEGITIVDGLPNGRHNTNHLRFGSDGRLYIPNGNPNDAGCPPDTESSPCPEGGSDRNDVFPYSGAILSVDPAAVSSSPAVLGWTDAQGNVIPNSQIASANPDFASKVQVLAHGFRNIFGVAFAPPSLPFAGVVYTAMNGPDMPSSQDVLYRVQPGTDYGFPFCYNQGIPGDTGASITMAANPLFPTSACGTVPTATALLGWHVCATGIDFPVDASTGLPNAAFPKSFRQSVFVGECTPFFPADLAAQIVADPAHAFDDTGHKIVRIALDDTGQATMVHDFLSGLILNTDVLFGPDGAMYVADAEGILRVAPVLP